MKPMILALCLPLLAACSTGGTDCDDATRALVAAQAGAAVAETMAAANPDSAALQQAAMVAGVALDAAEEIQSAMCAEEEGA
jgi:hypothetical protein